MIEKQSVRLFWWARCALPTLRCLLSIFIFFNLSMAYAKSAHVSDWYTKDNVTGVHLNIDLFLSSTCPHCQQTEAFFSALQSQNPWLNVNRHFINEDKAMLKLFYSKLKQFNSNDFSVPTIFFCDSRWLGFDTSETTGKGLIRALDYCHEKIEQEGKITQATRNTLRQWSATSKIDVNMKINTPHSDFERILITAMVEAISPCALFCLFLFLASIWMYPARRGVQFFLSMAMILALGIVHTMQYVFTNHYQQLLMHSTVFSWIVGGLLLLYLLQYINTHWRSGTRRSPLWFFPVLILSVTAVYIHQQSCDFSVGALFQHWLQTKSLTPSALYFYQLTYLAFYLLPLLVLTVFYLIFDVHPVKILPISGCVIIFVIGALLLSYPQGLASFWLSVFVLFFSLLSGWYLKRQNY